MADGDGSDSSTTFSRQRRDLFVVSGLLLLAQIAEVKVEKLGFLGVEIHFENASVFFTALWLLWAYWLLRYYQAFRDMQAQTTAVYAAYKNLLLKFAKDLAEKGSIAETLNLISNTPELDGAEPTVWNFYGQNIESGKAWVEWAPSVREKKGTIKSFEHRRFELQGFELNKLRCKSLIQISLNSMTFTEYIFPFVFGVSPAIYWASQQLRQWMVQ